MLGFKMGSGFMEGRTSRPARKAYQSGVRAWWHCRRCCARRQRRRALWEQPTPAPPPA